MRSVRWLMAAGGALLAACAGATEKAGSGDSAAIVADKGAGAPLRALSWRFVSPESWDDRVRIVDDPEGVQRLKEQGIHAARLFEYLPRDTSIVPQALLGVYVYDSTAWAKLEGEEGPPQGEVVTRGPGVVYVVGFPQSNPFAPGSADSVEFDRRAVTMEYVKRAFQVLR